MKGGIEVLFPTSYISDSNDINWLMEHSRSIKWTHEENKLFENALAVYDEDTPDRWNRVAEMIPGKTVWDVIEQYKELEADVSDIEAGLVPTPSYSTISPFTLEYVNTPNPGYDDGFKGLLPAKRSTSARPPRHPEQDRKKGVPWTEEEHRLFLLGLKKYGKGDWRNISRNFVPSRTPTQVASHAQKYFIRQQQHSEGKDKRRASIHDITTANLTDTLKSSSPQPSMMITHQPSSSATTSIAHFQWNNKPDVTIAMTLNPAHEEALMSPYGVNSYRFGIQEQNLFRSAPLHQPSYLSPKT